MCPSWTPVDPGDLPPGNVSKLDTGGSRRSASWKSSPFGLLFAPKILKARKFNSEECEKESEYVLQTTQSGNKKGV